VPPFLRKVSGSNLTSMPQIFAVSTASAERVAV